MSATLVQRLREVTAFLRFETGDRVAAASSLSEEAADRIEALEAEVVRCHERLEIEHVYKMEGDWLVRVEVPLEERSDLPDAIDCRDATIALLQEHEGEWRDISTAPRDGTEILAFVGPGYEGGIMILRWQKYNGLAAWRDCDTDVWEPTHWMPRPGPPK